MEKNGKESLPSIFILFIIYADNQQAATFQVFEEERDVTKDNNFLFFHGLVSLGLFLLRRIIFGDSWPDQGTF